MPYAYHIVYIIMWYIISTLTPYSNDQVSYPLCDLNVDFSTSLLSWCVYAVCISHYVLFSELLNIMIYMHVLSGDLKNPNKFNWSAEMSQAYAENRVADDIRQEQMKLDAADILIFQFPLYWMGFPGILKNWFDRVIHEGYAADVPSRTFDLARFKVINQ